MATGGVLCLGIYLVPPDHMTLIFVLGTGAAFALGPNAPILWSMYADVADYSEWRTGRRTTGLVFAAGVLSMKLGGAVGGWSLGAILDHFGYVPNVEQTDSSLHGILLAMSVGPAIFCFLAAAIVMAYILDDRKVALIERELSERRVARDNSDAARAATS